MATTLAGMPVLTVHLASYNHERYLREGLDSILGQTFEDFELIVIDDASSDGSWDLIRSVDDPRLKPFRHERNRGQYASINRALKIAQGEFFTSVGSDDVLDRRKFERQIGYFREHPQTALVATHVHQIDAAGNRVPGGSYEQWHNVMNEDFNQAASWIWRNAFCHSSVMVSKEWQDRIGPAREDFVYTGDWNWWIRFLAAGAPMKLLEEPLTRYRAHPDTMTHRDDGAVFREYAFTSATVLQPFLASRRDWELWGRNLMTFSDHAAFHRETPERQAAILAGLAEGGEAPSLDAMASWWREKEGRLSPGDWQRFGQVWQYHRMKNDLEYELRLRTEGVEETQAPGTADSECRWWRRLWRNHGHAKSDPSVD